MKKESPSVCVIVLNWNGKKHLEYCLPSLIKTDYDNYEILLVDNNSEDGSVEFVEKLFHQVKILKLPGNRGWAGGNNAGIKYALEKSFDYIALFNNDMCFDNRWLKYAVQVYERDKQIGFLGFDLLGDTRVSSSEEFEMARRVFKSAKVNNTGHIAGAAMFSHSSVYRNIGLIDDVYYIYGEENDLQARAVKAGYKLVQINIPLHHKQGGTDWSKKPLSPYYFSIRNTLRFAIKNEPLWKIPLFIGFIFHMSANPFKRIDVTDVTQRRFRPKGCFFNFLLCSYCLLWNLLFLPHTLWIRYADWKRIVNTRRILSKD